jgi:hypothetical protein
MGKNSFHNHFAYAFLVYAVFTISSFSPENPIGSQQLTHEVSVVNVAVPVHVFLKDVFVDTLAIKDFEVYENGVR